MSSQKRLWVRVLLNFNNIHIEAIQMKRGSRVCDQRRRELSNFQSDCDSDCETPRPNVLKDARRRLCSYSLEKHFENNSLNDSLTKKNSNLNIRFKVRSTICEAKSTDWSLVTVNKFDINKRRMTDGEKFKFSGSPLGKFSKKMPLPLYPNYKKKGKVYFRVSNFNLIRFMNGLEPSVKDMKSRTSYKSTFDSK